MAQPFRHEWNDGHDWVEFYPKLPMARLEKLLPLFQSVEGEDNLALAKRLTPHIGLLVESWSLESDPKSEDNALWNAEDVGDMIAVVTAMGEYVQAKMNVGKSGS